MPESRRVYLHLGLQKTGTSYLQGVMRHNRRLLADRGLDLVPEGRRDSFELMLLVRGRYNPQRDPDSVAGALERFSAQLARAPGSRALVSQESLAAARRAQVGRLVEACGDREVHVVLTVRDLARQVPSSWQQELKAGRTVGYGRWLERLQEAQRAGRGGHPWIQLDPPAVLARWARLVPAERIHVVTVPPPGSAPTLLLERYCRVLGVRADELAPAPGRGNTSLGRVQAELLRQVNLGLPDDLRRRQVYGDVGKRWFAAQVLRHQEADRILVPERLRPWCETVTAGQVAALEEAGYHVEGSLDDLTCLDTAFGADADATASDAELSAAAVEALVRVVSQRANARGRRARAARGRSLVARARRALARRGDSAQESDDL
ncbi:hypothetical protein [Nocardioides sp. GXQ0305]|uniref:hypothetical protein n=1 Tax=Nocardioides sp. GXQ0305 TaxID=3423912 RepID=UPI003D7EB1FB